MGDYIVETYPLPHGRKLAIVREGKYFDLVVLAEERDDVGSDVLLSLLENALLKHCKQVAEVIVMGAR